MKANNSITRFIKTHISLSLFTGTLLYALFSLLITDSVLSPDTASYFSAWTDSFSKGVPDMFRTPVYPFLLGIPLMMGGTQFQSIIFIIALQIILYSCSTIWLYKAGLQLTGNKVISLIIAIVYALYPMSGELSCEVLTESISISLMNAFLLVLVKLWKVGYSNKNATLLGVLLTILLFLRPSFIFLIIALAAWVIFWKIKKMPHAASLIVAISAPCLLLLAYCGWMNSTYGVFTLSKVGMHNRYEILRQNNNAHLDKISNEAIRKQFQENFAIEIEYDDNPTMSREITALIEQYGWPAVNNAVAECTRSNYPGFIDGAAYRLQRNYNKGINEFAPQRFNKIWSYLSIPFSNLLWFIAIIGLLIFRFRKDMKDWFLWLTLWIICVGNISVAVLGAQNAFGRLCYTSVGAYCILLGLLIMCIKVTVPNLNKFNKAEVE